MEKFSVSLPLKNEYLTTVRLTCGGLCSIMEFDVDGAEEYKVCVTESLLILKRNGYQKAEITFTLGESLACKIEGFDKTEGVDGSVEDEISYALLTALIGNPEFIKDENGKVKGIAFEG